MQQCNCSPAPPGNHSSLVGLHDAGKQKLSFMRLAGFRRALCCRRRDGGCAWPAGWQMSAWGPSTSQWARCSQGPRRGRPLCCACACSTARSSRLPARQPRPRCAGRSVVRWHSCIGCHELPIRPDLAFHCGRLLVHVLMEVVEEATPAPVNYVRIAPLYVTAPLCIQAMNAQASFAIWRPCSGAGPTVFSAQVSIAHHSACRPSMILQLQSSLREGVALLAEGSMQPQNLPRNTLHLIECREA